MENNNTLSLYDLKAGKEAEIVEIKSSEEQAAKLAAMGIAKGQIVSRKTSQVSNILRI